MQEQVLDHEEIEWQLEAVELALVEKWLEEHPSGAGVAIVPAAASELRDVYFDTEDWRFYRAGYKLRVRRDGQSAQATMKALVPPRVASAGAARSPSRWRASRPQRGSPGQSVNASEESPAQQMCARSSRFVPEGAPSCSVPKQRPQRRSLRTLRATSANRTLSKMPSPPKSHSTDLDVHLGRLSEESSRNGEVLEEVVTLLGERRIEARRRMLEALDSNRYERLIASYSGTLRGGRSPTPTSPILEAAPNLLRERYKKVRKAARTLSEDSPPEHYHELRKKGKRLRYALEPLQEIYGKPAKKMVKLLKKIQDDLGDHQDLIVASGLMEELGVAGDRPPQSAFSMGSTAERYGSEASEIRGGFLGSKPFRTLKYGRPWKKLRKKLE